jgi:uncharacterized protein (TIGR04222 family)
MSLSLGWDSFELVPFLTFTAFAVAVFGMAYRSYGRHEAPPDREVPDLSDPYQIAVLRKNYREVVRVATLMLCESRVLAASDGQVTATSRAPTLQHPLERALVDYFQTRTGFNSWSITWHAPVKRALRDIREDLTQAGLFNTGWRGLTTGARLLPMSVALVAILSLVTLYALSTARSGAVLGSPVVVVALYTVIYYIKVCLVAGPTVLGRKALKQAVKRQKPKLLRPGRPDDVALLAALSGINALPNTLFNRYEWLREKRNDGDAAV